jgi:flagellar assembly protein FliH
MKNLSDSVESFILCPFMEETEAGKDEEKDQFVSMFDRPARFAANDEYEEDKKKAAPDSAPAPVEKPVDVEAESRRIFEEAFAQGEKAGHEMGLQRVEPLAKRLNRYMSDLETFKDQLVERSHAMSVELALLFAEAVVLRSCNDNKEIVAEMVRKALDICDAKSDIVIRVRPDDAQYVIGEGNGFVKVLSDDSIREPGFVIETNFGDIDGRLSTQIEELRKRVFE